LIKSSGTSGLRLVIFFSLLDFVLLYLNLKFTLIYFWFIGFIISKIVSVNKWNNVGFDFLCSRPAQQGIGCNIRQGERFLQIRLNIGAFSPIYAFVPDPFQSFNTYAVVSPDPDLVESA
jgi:hypothetical protein